MLKESDFKGYSKIEGNKVKMQLGLLPFLIEFEANESEPEKAIENAIAHLVRAVEKTLYGDIRKSLYGVCTLDEVCGTQIETTILAIIKNMKMSPDKFTFKEVDDATQGEEEKDPT